VTVTSAGIISKNSNQDSENSDISANGRYVVFTSDAGNLTNGDNNGKRDIFVYDRDTDTTERVSISSAGVESNNSAYSPSISSSGRFITFQSSASNLVEGDTNQRTDIFVYDRDTHKVERISVNNSGSQGNGDSFPPSISGDGRYVTFQSAASNLVANDTNNESDIFVYDRDDNSIERVSVDSNGTEGNGVSSSPHLSADGRYVTFSSFASNLVNGDTNSRSDIFVYDRETHIIKRISLGGELTEGNSSSITPRISADGRYVTFESKANNLVINDTNSESDVFVYDRDTGKVERASINNEGQEGNGNSSAPSISADGRFIVFTSKATNLVSRDKNDESDIFIHDRTTGKTKRVSVGSAGKESNGFSLVPRISADGQYVTFESSANNLVSNDANEKNDIFTLENPFLRSTISSGLKAQSNNLLTVGGSDMTQLRVSVGGNTASEVSEIIMIATDDELGMIDGKAPGTDGYRQAALSRATVVLSVLEAGEFKDFHPERTLEVTGGQFLQFAILTGGSLSDLLNNGSGDVLFATATANRNGQSAISTTLQGIDSLQLSFRLPGGDPSKGVTLDVALGLDINRAGTKGQNGQSRIIDLTGLAGATVTASIDVFREAALNDTVGFFEVEDEQGNVKDPMTGNILSPDDPGYFQAALSHFAELSFTGQNGQTTHYTAQLATGKRLSTFLVVDGTMDELLDANAANDPRVYFNHIGANTDKKDHVRLLGDNTFGFEDMSGGGDMDFDDVIVKMSFK
jgi:Tol biopolymer transport system component